MIMNVGVTRADDIVPLKINARLGEPERYSFLRSSWPLVLHTVIGFISAYFPCIVTDLAKSA